MKRIDGLLTEFTTGANRVETSLSTMLALVSDGRVPSKSDIQSLETDLDGLQKAYDSIQLLASEVVAEEQLPDEGASVSDYAEAIKNSEVLRIKEQLREIEIRLQRFIAVKSLVVAFEEALKPYQEAAHDLLAKLDTSTSPSPGELEKTTEAHKLFLEAIATEDFDSDAGMDLMEKIEEHYPSKVQRGLMLNKYYIDEEASVGAVEETLIVTPALSVDEAGAEAVPEVEAPAEVAPSEEVETVEVAPTLTSEEVPPEDSVEDVEAAEPPKMIKANSKIKSKTASATAFKHEILNMSHEVCTILPMFTNLGALTATQIYAFGSSMDCFGSQEETEESVQKALDLLTAKSIVVSYTVEGFDQPIYCLTAYGYDSLTKRSIAVDMKKIFTLSFGKRRMIGREEISEDILLNCVLHNTCLLLYFGHIWATLEEKFFERTKQSITWKDDHYTLAVFADSGEYECYVAVLHENLDELLKRGNILIYAENVASADPPPEGPNKVFLHDTESLYMWDGEWVLQTAAFKCSEVDEVDPPVDDAAVVEDAVTETIPEDDQTVAAAAEEFGCQHIGTCGNADKDIDQQTDQRSGGANSGKR